MFDSKRENSRSEKTSYDIVEICENAREKVESLENLSRSAESAVNSIKSFGASIADGLSKLKAVLDERRFNTPFTYAESIRYLASHAKDSPKIAKGAILKRPAHNGKTNEECWEICLLFLDKDSNPVCDENGIPFGFKTIRTKLDGELRNAFKDNDLIIVE